MLVSYTAQPHERINDIKACNCNHPKCNGLYLELWKGQEHCLYWYKDKNSGASLT